MHAVNRLCTAAFAVRLPPMAEVLVVYYSREGSTAELARQACRGIEAIEGATATLRTVPAVSARSEAAPQAVPDQGPPYATLDDLRRADALQPAAIRQYGRTAEIFSRFDLEPVARRHSGRQAGGGIHRHPDHARRTGDHTAVDDAAAAATPDSARPGVAP